VLLQHGHGRHGNDSSLLNLELPPHEGNEGGPAKDSEEHQGYQEERVADQVQKVP
jgi:hypothetical protein